MGPQKAVNLQTKMTAGNGSKLRGNTRYPYSVHMINHKNVINVHSIDVILPVLTSWHTQRERTIVSVHLCLLR